MLDTKLGYNLLKNDTQGPKSDETLNKRPHDISLAQLHDQICCVYQTVLLLQFQRRKFQTHDYKIDQSIEFSQSTTYWVGELDNYELHCCLIKYQSIHVAV